MAVELPLACAVTIAVPAWFVAAFAAGWINWWQRASRPRPAGSAIPPFSWIKAGAFVVVVAAAQSIGFALAGNAAGWPVLLEVAAALIAIAVIGSSYGAAWPISIGFGLRVVVAGVRARLGADRSARRVLDAAASSMSRTAQQIAEANPRDPSAAHTASTLWQAAADLQAHRSSEAGVSPQALGILVAQALRDAGPMVDTPLADQAAAAAARAGSPAPVLVEEARFGSPELSGVQMRRGDAATLRRLLTSCVVEARRHGTGRLDVRVDRDGPRVIVRMANRISPATKPGRSRGGREIAALADRLPDGRLEMRGVTGREFLGLPGQGELYGVRFSFSAPSPRTSARAPASWQC